MPHGAYGPPPIVIRQFTGRTITPNSLRQTFSKRKRSMTTTDVQGAVLYHQTSFLSAESILWNRMIHGCSWNNIECHEAFPHFFMKHEPQNSNQLRCNHEIDLYFLSDLPITACPENVPQRDCINRHVGFSGNFWQATIYPGHSITFQNAVVREGKCSKFLMSLTELRKGSNIRTAWHPAMKRSLILPPAETCNLDKPNKFRQLAFRLFKYEPPSD